MKAVLDTSVVIASGIDRLPGDLAISAVTMAELHFGVLVAENRAARAERLRRLLLLGRTFDPLPVDGAVAASYGHLCAAVIEAGRHPRPRSLDLMIAATARAHSARLYTRNGDDFIGLGDLIEVVTV